jgi:hypothetical protein
VRFADPFVIQLRGKISLSSNNPIFFSKGVAVMQTSSPEQPAVRTKTTTVWLWIVIILNALVGLLSFTQIGTLADLGISPLFLIVSALLSLGVAVGTYMILQWKKMGFYIVVGCIVLNVLVSILGGSGFASIAGAVIGLGILYYVLQYPKDNKAWNHLA